jgi:hypothetical protein
MLEEGLDVRDIDAAQRFRLRLPDNGHILDRLVLHQ